MSYQLSSQLHVRTAIQDLAFAYRADLSAYSHDKILPIKIAPHRSDFIRAFSRSALLRVPDLYVGPSGAPQMINFKLDQSKTYSCMDVSLETVIDYREGQDADAIIQYEQEKMYWLMTAFQQGMEYYVIKQIMRDPAIITNYTDLSSDVSQQWDQLDSPNSRPIEMIREQIEKMRLRLGGKTPNFFGLSRIAWNQIRFNKSVLAYGGLNTYVNALITPAIFEEACGLPPGSMHLMETVYNAARRDQTEALRLFIGPDAFLAYTEQPNVRAYGLGYQHWFPGGGDSSLFESTPDVLAGSPIVVLTLPDISGQFTLAGGHKNRIVGGLDAKIHNVDAAYLWRNVVNKNNTSKFEDYLKDEPA